MDTRFRGYDGIGGHDGVCGYDGVRGYDGSAGMTECEATVARGRNRTFCRSTVQFFSSYNKNF